MLRALYPEVPIFGSGAYQTRQSEVSSEPSWIERRDHDTGASTKEVQSTRSPLN